jgi:hypothetical protein
VAVFAGYLASRLLLPGSGRVAFRLRSGCYISAVALVFLRMLLAVAYVVEYVMEFVLEYDLGYSASCWQHSGCVLVVF